MSHRRHRHSEHQGSTWPEEPEQSRVPRKHTTHAAEHKRQPSANEEDVYVLKWLSNVKPDPSSPVKEPEAPCEKRESRPVPRPKSHPYPAQYESPLNDIECIENVRKQRRRPRSESLLEPQFQYRRSPTPRELSPPKPVQSDRQRRPSDTHREKHSNKRPRPRSLSSSSHHSSSSSSSLPSVKEIFEKRARHKTKEDRYDPKKKRKKSEKKRSPSKPRNPKKEKRGDRQKAAKKAGEDLMQGFASKHLGQDRLTIRPSNILGLFKKGRAASPSRRRGVPDLAFHEMEFLQNRYRRPSPEKEEVIVSKSRKKERRKAEREREEITSYFKPPPKQPLREGSGNANFEKPTAPNDRGRGRLDLDDGFVPYRDRPDELRYDSVSRRDSVYTSSEKPRDFIFRQLSSAFELEPVTARQNRGSPYPQEYTEQRSRLSGGATSYVSWSESIRSRGGSRVRQPSRSPVRPRNSTTPDSVWKSLENTGVFCGTGIHKLAGRHRKPRSLYEDQVDVVQHNDGERAKHKTVPSKYHKVAQAPDAVPRPQVASSDEAMEEARTWLRSTIEESRERSPRQQSSCAGTPQGTPPRQNQAMQATERTDKNQHSPRRPDIEVYDRQTGWRRHDPQVLTSPHDRRQLAAPQLQTRSREQMARDSYVRPPQPTVESHNSTPVVRGNERPEAQFDQLRYQANESLSRYGPDKGHHQGGDEDGTRPRLSFADEQRFPTEDRVSPPSDYSAGQSRPTSPRAAQSQLPPGGWARNDNARTNSGASTLPIPTRDEHYRNGPQQQFRQRTTPQTSAYSPAPMQPPEVPFLNRLQARGFCDPRNPEADRAVNVSPYPDVEPLYNFQLAQQASRNTLRFRHEMNPANYEPPHIQQSWTNQGSWNRNLGDSYVADNDLGQGFQDYEGPDIGYDEVLKQEEMDEMGDLLYEYQQELQDRDWQDHGAEAYDHHLTQNIEQPFHAIHTLPSFGMGQGGHDRYERGDLGDSGSREVVREDIPRPLQGFWRPYRAF